MHLLAVPLIAAILALVPVQNGAVAAERRVVAQGAESASPMRPPEAAAPRRPKAERRPGQAPRVYLLRGLFNVYSMGLDTLAAKLQARGVSTVVLNHNDWASVAEAISRERRSGMYRGPVVLVGHSLGGNDIIKVAQQLSPEGIAVDLLVAVDAVGPAPMPPNVARAVNYFQSNNGWGKPLRPGQGFRGTLVNADLETNRRDLSDPQTTHQTIDESDKVHAEIVRAVVGLSAGRRP